MYPNYGMNGINIGIPGMATRMEMQGQMQINQGQQDRQFGAIELNQGRIQKNIGYQQEMTGQMEIAQGNYAQGMRDLNMGRN